jgi:hypothetical protein
MAAIGLAALASSVLFSRRAENNDAEILDSIYS